MRACVRASAIYARRCVTSLWRRAPPCVECHSLLRAHSSVSWNNRFAQSPCSTSRPLADAEKNASVDVAFLVVGGWVVGGVSILLAARTPALEPRRCSGNESLICRGATCAQCERSATPWTLGGKISLRGEQTQTHAHMRDALATGDTATRSRSDRMR